jgi:hypothetical protein
MLERLVPGALERKSLGQNDQSPGEPFVLSQALLIKIHSL